MTNTNKLTVHMQGVESGCGVKFSSTFMVTAHGIISECVQQTRKSQGAGFVLTWEAVSSSFKLPGRQRSSSQSQPSLLVNGGHLMMQI